MAGTEQAAEGAAGGGGESAFGGEAEATTPAAETPAPTPEAGGEAATPEPAGGGQEGSPLLAAPARREDGSTIPYLTPGSKGKIYTPVVVKKYTSGSRSKSFRSKSMPRPNTGFMKNPLGYGIAETQENDLFQSDEELLIEAQEKISSLKKSLLEKKENTEDKKDGT